MGSPADERDPHLLPDGSGIVYVSDRNGVFNVYMLDFESTMTTRLTDLYSGAFCPSVGKNGYVYYAGYKCQDFSIYRTSLNKVLEKTKTVLEKRNYLSQPVRFDLSEHFKVKPISGKRIVNAIVRVLNIGP